MSDSSKPEAVDEDWFDTEIAPVLIDLCKRCADRGMSFFADVEYAPEKFSRTCQLTDDADLAMRLLLECSRAGSNIDSFFINVARLCRQRGVNTSASFVMQRLFPPAASGNVADE